MLTQKRLKELLAYTPETGVFTWAKPRGGKVAGAVAGTIHYKQGYIRIKIDGGMYSAHRLAWLYVYGEMPEHEIDHINHDRQDNRIENLRSVTRHQNARNRALRADNTSGVVGVNWFKRNKKWGARIFKNGKFVFLGLFDRFEDAAEARKNASLKYGFHPNHGL